MEKVLVVLVVLMVTTQVQVKVDQVDMQVLVVMVNGLNLLVCLVVDQEQDQVVLLEVR